MREQTHLSKDRAVELEKQVEQLNVTNRRVLDINKSLMEELNHYKSNSSIDYYRVPRGLRSIADLSIFRDDLGVGVPKSL